MSSDLHECTHRHVYLHTQTHVHTRASGGETLSEMTLHKNAQKSGSLEEKVCRSCWQWLPLVSWLW